MTISEKSGLKIGDYIIAVDGFDVKGLTYEELRPLVIGETGTAVKITYLRDNKHYDVDMLRADISYSVAFKVVNNDIGYLQINTFGSLTPKELTHALDEFKAKNIKNLIIDLRDNGGGYLDALIKMADCFLLKGMVIFTQQYVRNEVVDYKANTDER